MTRIATPPLDHYFGLPAYDETPTFQQLESEIRERAYLLWEKHGWDAQRCWVTAERTLFWKLEPTAFNGLGYRVYVRNGCGWSVKIITPSFPVSFISVCHPVTLCSVIKRKCPDNK